VAASSTAPSDAVDQADAPEASAATSALPASTPPAEPAAATTARRAGLLPALALALATVAAVLSAVGLVVASRTVAEARIAIEALPARTPAVSSTPASAPAVASAAVTAADLDKVIVALRRDIAQAGLAQDGAKQAAAIAAAQAELANRISMIGLKLDRIERSLNASRGAPRAGDRAPLS